jgi:hypothetical protein
MTEPIPFPEAFGQVFGEILAAWTHDFTWRPDTALFNALLTRIKAADGAALGPLWIEIREAWLGQSLTRDQDLELCEAWSARLGRLVAPKGAEPAPPSGPDAFTELEYRIRTADGAGLNELGGVVAQAGEAGQLAGDNVNTLHASWEQRLLELVAPGDCDD